jgi:endonuclease YncB( thermonuclease family)
MSFNKPFKSTPINLGLVYRNRTAKERRLRSIKSAVLLSTVAVGVFAAGMLATRDKIQAITGLANANAAEATTCHLLSVHDGDTIRCGAERIRIENIDAPELEGSPKCRDYRAAHAWCDFEQGRRSRDALKAFLARGTVFVVRDGEDKYGRTLARVSVNGRDAGEYLIAQGLARPWR